jgi:TrmH family RNA methyltransferase
MWFLCYLGEEMIEITSGQNLKIKHVLTLRNKKERDEEKLFLIEGYREILRAEKIVIKELFYCEELFLKDNERALIERVLNSGAQIFKCSRRVFEKISYRDRPDGLLAIAEQTYLRLQDISIVKDPLFVVLESIEKPGNLGTILRSSDGAKVDGVIVVDPHTDIFNPNVVRASIGTLFTVPLIISTVDETIAFFKQRKVKVVATSPHAKRAYFETDLTGPIALVMGCEQYGLSQRWLKEADINIFIPMLGKADSLNVATAATIVIYEALRQRKYSIS